MTNNDLIALLTEVQENLARHVFGPESPACVMCGGESGFDVGRVCPKAHDYDLLQRVKLALEEPVENVPLREELPPGSPEGDGLPRYGLRWDGPDQPVAVPMDDGYWTPFHLAAAAAAVAADELRASSASASRGWQMADELRLTVRDLKAGKKLRRLKSLLDLLARVFDWSDSSYEHAVMHVENAVNNLRADLAAEKKNFDEAIAAQDQALTSRHNKSVDWYQQRFNALRTWVNQEVKPLSEETAHRYFAIVANGAPAPHEQADWRETMHGLTLRAEKAERDLDQMRQCIAGFVEVVEAAEAHATGPKGGQQVTFSGDFASAPPSTRGQLRWWARRLKEASNEHSPESHRPS
jgi:hypothetical protein